MVGGADHGDEVRLGSCCCLSTLLRLGYIGHGVGDSRLDQRGLARAWFAQQEDGTDHVARGLHPSDEGLDVGVVRSDAGAGQVLVGGIGCTGETREQPALSGHFTSLFPISNASVGFT